jgi:Rap1a immunity proteins
MVRSALLGAVALALTATAAGAAEDSRSANYLLPACRDIIGRTNSSSPVLQGYCMGIVSEISHIGFGVALAQSFTSYTNGVPEPIIRKMYCLVVPDGVTNNQMVRIVVAYIEKHPTRMHEDFRDLALEAIREAWPCK